MTYPVLGHALIIDIEDFVGYPGKKRHGSHHDSNNLQELLQQLGFKV